jgi:type III pantothenate kinase
VPPRDPEVLAGALRALLDEPARRVEYGRRGVERARRLYGWGRVAGLTQEVYSDVLARSRSARGRPAALGRRAGSEHLSALAQMLESLRSEVEHLERWGAELGRALADGARLLVVGNGGSAAQAQHLTAELVGRFETDRQPLSAICLHGDTSSLTAITNDYGPEHAFARQVRAHARAGDFLLALSTSGKSQNVIAAVHAARELGLATLALTGPAPNELADVCEDAVAIAASSAATVQEGHLVALHLVCGAVDRELALARGRLEARA